MATCKDCFHHNVCEARANLGDITADAEACENFIDSSRVIVPPCKVGDTVYLPMETDGECEPYVDVGTVFAIGIDESCTIWISVRYESGLKYYHTSDDFGKTVFFTREEVEAVLKKASNP